MMASGFKPVGWVAGVAASAIGCYMLSLNVASERAELLRIEQQIVAAKQDIRSLQTELGTRGRLAQLEQWNVDVLALSAPTTPQFLENEVKLARFDTSAPTLEERAKVRMASAAPAPAAPAARIEAPVLKASAPEPVARARGNAFVHQAGLTIPAPKVQTAAAPPAKPTKPARPAEALPASAKPAGATATLPLPAKPIRTASADMVVPKPIRSAIAQSAPASARPMQYAKPASRIDASLTQQIAAAARLEASRGTR